MIGITKLCWAALALLHIVPAAAAFIPGLSQSLYGVSVDETTAVLLHHRAVLFLAIFVTAIFALIDPNSRRLASVILGISVVGYLLIYWKAGLPAGPLRKIAIPDAIGLVPLIWVTVQAWR